MAKPTEGAKKTKVRSRAEILAAALGEDLSEVKHFRYQPGRTTTPVWAMDHGTFTVTKGDEAPDTESEGWVEYAASWTPPPAGYKIWIQVYTPES